MSDTGDASMEKSPARASCGNRASAASSHDNGPSDPVVAAPEREPPATAAAGPAAPASDCSAAPRSLTHFGLSRGDTWFALVVGGVILALMLINWAHVTWRGEPRAEIDRLQAGAYEFQLDINRATWVEWMQLEGIGETLARRIVADREANGPFHSIDDLNRVSGIGPKTLAAIHPHLRCPDCPTSTETPS